MVWFCADWVLFWGLFKRVKGASPLLSAKLQAGSIKSNNKGKTKTNFIMTLSLFEH
jgi:hypothetical protein